MATTNAGQFNVARISLGIAPNGDVHLNLGYINQQSLPVTVRDVFIPANGGPITDQLNRQIVGSVPAALANAITTFLSQIDTMIANGAGAGKLDL